jgi:hypothetical protein
MAGFSGGCLCGAVKYQSTVEPQIVAHCYCIDCRKSSGTGHCTHIAIAEDGFTVSGALTFYDSPADSGAMVSRGFCPRCGSAVYSKNSNMPGAVFPRASSLDDPDTVTPQVSVYASRAAAWDPVDPNLPSFPEMPDISPEEMPGNMMAKG